MKKSKTPIFVLAILSVVLLCAGIAVYIVAPSWTGDWSFKSADLFAAFGELPAVFGTLMGFENKALFAKFEIGVLILDVLLLAAFAVLVIMWIINLILLIVKKKPIHLIPNLAWLLAAGASVILLTLAIVPAKNGSSFVGTLFEGSGMAKDGMAYYHDALGAIGGSISSEYGKGLALAAGLFILILLAAYILGLVAIIKSTAALAKEKKKKAVDENADEYEEDEEECECECEAEEEKKDEKAGPYIIQNFYNGSPMPYPPYHECHCHEHKEEPKPEPVPEPEPEEEDRPLTAKELRAIIREELDDREHPEELEPLTDERAREVIQEELSDYYTCKEEEEPEVEEEESDVMTADDLRKMIKEEVEGAMKPSEEPSLTKEEVRDIIREELGAPKEEKESLTSDEVRTIIAEELAKYLQNIAVVEEVEPTPEPTPEPVPEPEPEPEPEPVPEPEPEPEPAPAAAPVIRLSFAEKVTAAPQEVKDNYNDLKAYALGYGLKSRVANGGDTFRLHTKTYFRINMVGKGLKLYYALDPKDYADSPIPVQDVGHKNLYKDIPLCFKVRSGLSVKRAKQLIDDVCGKAGLTAGAPVDTRDYAADLVNYVNDGSDSGDDED